MINEFFSQQNEDQILFKKYLNYRNGFFIELGAMNGVTYSNTKFFEETLDWTGILIEPTAQFEQLVRNRPRCYTFNFAITEQTGDIDFLGEHAIGGVLNLMHPEHKKHWNLNDDNKFSVKSAPLSLLTKQVNAKAVDLFSIDVEGGELEVLKSFDWSIPVYIVLVELDGRNKEKDESCRQILSQQGLVFDMTIGNNEVWINHNFSNKC